MLCEASNATTPQIPAHNPRESKTIAVTHKPLANGIEPLQRFNLSQVLPDAAGWRRPKLASVSFGRRPFERSLGSPPVGSIPLLKIQMNSRRWAKEKCRVSSALGAPPGAG